MIKGTLNGVNLILAKFKNVEVAASAEVGEALTRSAFRVQRHAKRSIQDSPPDSDTGRSKPGNPPKTDTGRLVNSIFVDIDVSAKKCVARVGTNVAYGRYLEFGTQSIEPRPWLQPAMEATKRENTADVARAVQKAVKRAKK